MRESAAAASAPNPGRDMEGGGGGLWPIALGAPGTAVPAGTRPVVWPESLPQKRSKGHFLTSLRRASKGALAAHGPEAALASDEHGTAVDGAGKVQGSETHLLHVGRDLSRRKLLSARFSLFASAGPSGPPGPRCEGQRRVALVRIRHFRRDLRLWPLQSAQAAASGSV